MAFGIRLSFALALLGSLVMPAGAGETDWSNGSHARTRLTSGLAEDSGRQGLYVFVEVELPKGWKTYWRNPGDAGGLPPRFDWSGSENLESATVLYPAPLRLTDEAGDTIGYKDKVIFPVRVAPKDPASPVRLALQLSYGICKDICVPEEAKHGLSVDGKTAEKPNPEARASLDAVPRLASAGNKAGPELKNAALTASGRKLVFDVAYPEGTSKTDMFVEAPDGIYVPMVGKPAVGADGVHRFEVELGPALSAAEIKGKRLTLTLVGSNGSTEATAQIE